MNCHLISLKVAVWLFRYALKNSLHTTFSLYIVPAETPVLQSPFLFPSFLLSSFIVAQSKYRYLYTNAANKNVTEHFASLH